MTPPLRPPVGDGDPVQGESEGIARHSVSVAGWTAVSRVTGVGRVVAIAGVLGPTYLGNLFQATNVLPNLVYEMMIGSLLAALLVPALVPRVETSDPRDTERVAGGFLGVILVGFALVTALAIAAGPLILRLLSLGVVDRAAAHAQQRVGWFLLAMLMPQVALYGLVGTAAAVMNAHGRFALASSAPALENLGVIAVMIATAVVFGTGPNIQRIPRAEVFLLGVGATAAVALHALVQWWGAQRVGVRLVPRAGWRDPEVREIVKRAVPSLGYTALNSLRYLMVLVVANRVPGGVVAFQLGVNFLFVPVALGARPVATAMLPPLSRMKGETSLQSFREELVRATGLALFLVVPASVTYVVLAGPLAHAVAFGAMAHAGGVALVTVSLASLGPGVVGEAVCLMGTQASYALHDAGLPLRSMVLRAGLTIAGMAVAFWAAEGSTVLILLGLSLSVGSLAGAGYLLLKLRSRLPHVEDRLAPAAIRALVASALMVGPAYLVMAFLGRGGSRLRDVVGVLLGALVGLGVYVGVQRLWRSPELRMLHRVLPFPRRGRRAVWAPAGEGR